MKTVELPEEVKDQIEKAYNACTVEVPSTDVVRVTNLENFTRVVEELLKVGYLEGILEGLRKGKELLNRVETQY